MFLFPTHHFLKGKRKMKKTIKSLAIIAIVAVIGFTMTACKEEPPPPPTIPAKVTAFNNQGNKPSTARSIVSTPLASVSSTIYDNFYTGLGDKVSDITPTKLNVAATMGVILSNGLLYEYETDFFDFVKGVTIEVGEVPVGITVSAMVMTLYHNLPTGEWSTVEFTWPTTQQDFQDSSYTSVLVANTLGGYTWQNIPDFTPSLTSGTVKLAYEHIGQWFNSIGSVNRVPDIDIIIYYNGNTREIIDGPMDISELGFTGIEQNIIVPHYVRGLKIPFTPITIPENASSVTFSVSWNTNGIISRYKGMYAEYDHDDIYVLKDGWWEEVYITTNVQ